MPDCRAAGAGPGEQSRIGARDLGLEGACTLGRRSQHEGLRPEDGAPGVGQAREGGAG